VRGSIKRSNTKRMFYAGTLQVAAGGCIKVALCDAGVPANASGQHSFETNVFVSVSLKTSNEPCANRREKI
jgi:hypothetical protein